MNLPDFIALHRVMDGSPRDVLDPDFDILHAIEFCRRHPDCETIDELLRAARREGGGAQVSLRCKHALRNVLTLASISKAPGRRKI